MHDTPISSMICFLIAAFLGAIGQYLYQSGATSVSAGWSQFLVSPRILGGVACYVAVMVLFVIAFRLGGSMAVLYPLYASTFIWAALIARWIYQTPISRIHVLGWFLLIAGMACMGWTGKPDPITTDDVVSQGTEQ